MSTWPVPLLSLPTSSLVPLGMLMWWPGQSLCPHAAGCQVCSSWRIHVAPAPPSSRLTDPSFLMWEGGLAPVPMSILTTFHSESRFPGCHWRGWGVHSMQAQCCHWCPSDLFLRSLSVGSVMYSARGRHLPQAPFTFEPSTFKLLLPLLLLSQIFASSQVTYAGGLMFPHRNSESAWDWLLWTG